MYIPKFLPKKENLKIVQKYNNETIFNILLLYLKNGISNRQLDELILNLRTPGYESDNILKYYGITEKHRGIFNDLNISEIIQLLKKENQIIYELLEILTNYQHLYEYPTKSGKVIIQEEDEAYYNAEMKVRNRDLQHKLRIKLLEEFGSKCCICNIKIPDLLVASHIIPYSQCNEEIGKLSNPNNALLLCTLHDKLFESSNHITFKDGKIKIEDSIKEKEFHEYKINNNITIPDKYLNEERVKFLEKHVEIFNIKHKKND